MRLFFGLLFVLILTGCFSNNPYPVAEWNQNYYYTAFEGIPKHLDPARSYSSDEYELIANVYEPPFQFHYLKRPFALDPLSVREIPAPEYSGDKVIYTFRVKPGIRYQNHPCFAKGADGKPLYTNLQDADLKPIERPDDFAETGTRELVAEDFAYAIKRLALPSVECPIFPTLAGVIDGYAEFQETLRQEVEAEREKRKKTGGLRYQKESDETLRPILPDLEKKSFPGLRVVDRRTFQIILNRKYPQLLFWMTLPFFSPVPPEAIRFYSQPALIKKGLDLAHWPVGTGPYRFERFEPNRRIILTRNENFDHETYPVEGESSDRTNGFLADAGKKLPFIDKIILMYEKEDIPRWNKFLQGYYDASGISADNFDHVIQFQGNEPAVQELFQKKGIELATEVASSISYWGFNMLDPVVGGYTPAKQKLRQALSIAIDTEDFLQIFANGRGISAMGPLPPGIPGFEESGMNVVVYEGSPKAPVRRSLAEAKQLLAEAGYPGGVGKDGPLVLHFDGTFTGPGSQSLMVWFRKQFDKLNIQLEFRNTTYRQFQEKMEKGTGQIFRWGWNADYPDAENFFFLL
ncbi:MAG: peptide ABC transporter substrate-binding protein, partial [Spirochaetia bacterium]|nr:peptide ABC transporter substrate-binding protein [Spirochaetia bacterium]